MQKTNVHKSLNTLTNEHVQGQVSARRTYSKHTQRNTERFVALLIMKSMPRGPSHTGRKVNLLIINWMKHNRYKWAFCTTDLSTFVIQPDRANRCFITMVWGLKCCSFPYYADMQSLQCSPLSLSLFSVASTALLDVILLTMKVVFSNCSSVWMQNKE